MSGMYYTSFFLMNAERLDYQSEHVAPVYPEISDRDDLAWADSDAATAADKAYDGVMADSDGEHDIDDDCFDLPHTPLAGQTAVAVEIGAGDESDKPHPDKPRADGTEDEPAVEPGGPPDDIPPDGPGSGGLFEGDDFNQPDAALVDELFEVFAGDPPTEEEVAEVRQHEESIRWLGSERVNPHIFSIFNADRHGDSDALDTLEANRVFERQLSHLTESVAELEEGIRATEDLAGLIERYVDRYVVERIGILPEWLDGRFYIAQRVVEPVEDGFTVEASFVRRATGPQEPAMLQRDHPNGETRLVTANAQQRYRVQHSAEHGVTVVRETIRSLGPSDAPYFRDLHILLSNHRQHLLHIAQRAGFDPDTLAEHAGRVEAITSDPGFQFSVPEGLRRAIIGSAMVVRRTLNQTLTRDPYTHETEDAGLFTVAGRVRTYFEALLDGPDDEPGYRR